MRKGRASVRVRYLFYFLFLFLIGLSLMLYSFYLSGVISESNFIAITSIAQSFIFSLIAICYMLIKGYNLNGIVAGLGLSRKSIGIMTVVIGIALFLVIFALEIGIGAFTAATGIQLPTNVQQVLGGLPLYFLIFSVVVAPINEEILFRGFLVPRWGIIISALVFGFLHYLSYLSLSEFIAAFVFGLAAGYVRKRTNSLYPSIMAHMLVNLIAILALLAL